MDFYHGKDNGYIVRFASIIILNTGFYLLMAIGKKRMVSDYLKQGGLGLLTAIIIGVVGYLIFLSADYYGLTYHIATLIICYTSYVGLKKVIGSNQSLNKNKHTPTTE